MEPGERHREHQLTECSTGGRLKVAAMEPGERHREHAARLALAQARTEDRNGAR